MVIQGHVFLVLVLLLISSLVLWIFITSSNTRWYVKAIITIALLLSIASSWIGLKAIYGFPYAEHPNNKSYYLVGSYIVEPNVKRNIEGNIYVWLIPKKSEEHKMAWLVKLGLVANKGQPRAYIMPYDKELHKMLVGIESQRGGQAISVKIVPKKKGNSHKGDEKEDRQKYVPYILPEDHINIKDYTIIDTGDKTSKIIHQPTPPEEPTSFFGDTDSIREQQANTSDGTPEEQVDIGVSPDGTPDINNNTQEQQLPTDRGGNFNRIP